MEMQQVRYFVALAGTLNFTRAAEQCNVSQPALTRAIQQLEHAQEIVKLKKRLNEIYAQHTGQSVEAIEKMLDRDTYMSSDC